MPSSIQEIKDLAPKLNQAYNNGSDPDLHNNLIYIDWRPVRQPAAQGRAEQVYFTYENGTTVKERGTFVYKEGYKVMFNLKTLALITDQEDISTMAYLCVLDEPIVRRNSKKIAKLLDRYRNDLTERGVSLALVKQNLESIQEITIKGAELFLEEGRNIIGDVQTGTAADIGELTEAALSEIAYYAATNSFDLIIGQADELTRKLPPGDVISGLEHYAQNQKIKWAIEKEWSQKGGFSFPMEERYSLKRVLSSDGRKLRIEVHLLENRPGDIEVSEILYFLLEENNKTFILATNGANYVTKNGEGCNMYRLDPVKSPVLPLPITQLPGCCEAIYSGNQALEKCGLIEDYSTYKFHALGNNSQADYYVYSREDTELTPSCTDVAKNEAVVVRDTNFIKASCPFKIKDMTAGKIIAGVAELISVIPASELYPVAEDILKFVRKPNSDGLKSMFNLFTSTKLALPHATAIEVIVYLLMFGVTATTLWMIYFSATWCVRKCCRTKERPQIYALTTMEMQPMAEWPRPSAPPRPILKRTRTHTTFSRNRNER